jgi:hypothetical protein
MDHPIGKLKRVPLREVWPHEAHDFTRWLQDNVEVLNDVIDLHLVDIEREQNTGRFMWISSQQMKMAILLSLKIN